LEEIELKMPILKLALAGTLALSLSACNNANEQGTGGMQQNDGIGQNSVGRNGIQQNGFGQNNAGQNGMRQNNRPNGIYGTNEWDNRLNNNQTSPHNNTRMIMSRYTAEEIAEMDGIRSANVLLTDHNAYVGVVMDNNAGQQVQGGTSGLRSKINGNSYYNYSTGMNETYSGVDNGGNRIGNNGIGNRGLGAGAGTNGAGAGTNGAGAGTNGAGAGTNGGMAGGIGDYDMEDRMKARIADIVKSVNPSVRNVYVSANPGFVDRINGYAESFGNGRPIRGMILEFNEMVERVFPDNAGSANQMRNGVTNTR
jgi:hypothetical protein